MPFPICVPSPSSTGAGDGLGRERLAAAAAGPRTRPHFRARERGAVASRRVASRRCAVPRTPFPGPMGERDRGMRAHPGSPGAPSPHTSPCQNALGEGTAAGVAGESETIQTKSGSGVGRACARRPVQRNSTMRFRSPSSAPTAWAPLAGCATVARYSSGKKRRPVASSDLSSPLSSPARRSSPRCRRSSPSAQRRPATSCRRRDSHYR